MDRAVENWFDVFRTAPQEGDGLRRGEKLPVLVVRDLGKDEMRDGTPMRVNDRTVYVLESPEGQPVVSYVDRNHMGYMFMAPDLTVNELVWLVSRTDLVGPQ